MSSFFRCFRCRVSHHTSAPINITHRAMAVSNKVQTKTTFVRSLASKDSQMHSKKSRTHARTPRPPRDQRCNIRGGGGIPVPLDADVFCRPQPTAAAVVVTAAFARQDVVFQTLLLDFVSISGIPNASTFNNLFQSVTKSTTHSLSLTL